MAKLTAKKRNALKGGTLIDRKADQILGESKGSKSKSNKRK